MRSRGTLSTTTIVWLALLLAGAASWWLGVDASGSADGNHAVMIVGVLAIAFAKIWLIVRYFMEVRFAPLWLRTLLDVWIVGVFIMLTILYLKSGADTRDETTAAVHHAPGSGLAEWTCQPAQPVSAIDRFAELQGPVSTQNRGMSRRWNTCA
jgi:hypothetical protein